MSVADAVIIQARQDGVKAALDYLEEVNEDNTGDLDLTHGRTAYTKGVDAYLKTLQDNGDVTKASRGDLDFALRRDAQKPFDIHNTPLSIMTMLLYNSVELDYKLYTKYWVSQARALDFSVAVRGDEGDDEFSTEATLLETRDAIFIIYDAVRKSEGVTLTRQWSLVIEEVIKWVNLWAKAWHDGDGVDVFGLVESDEKREEESEEVEEQDEDDNDAGLVDGASIWFCDLCPNHAGIKSRRNMLARHFRHSHGLSYDAAIARTQQLYPA